MYILAVIIWFCIAQLCRHTLGGGKIWYTLPIIVRIFGLLIMPFIFLVFVNLITEDLKPTS